jgi:hypothetical protein
MLRIGTVVRTESQEAVIRPRDELVRLLHRELPSGRRGEEVPRGVRGRWEDIIERGRSDDDQSDLVKRDVVGRCLQRPARLAFIGSRWARHPDRIARSRGRERHGRRRLAHPRKRASVEPDAVVPRRGIGVGTAAPGIPCGGCRAPRIDASPANRAPVPAVQAVHGRLVGEEQLPVDRRPVNVPPVPGDVVLQRGSRPGGAPG